MLSVPSPVRRVLQWNLVLLGLVTALFFLNFYQRTLFSRPMSYHQWRQADCLSIAKNYYEEGMDFFRPVIHYQGVEGGRAVGECPILNYKAALLWKIFGEHEFLYRLMVYAIFLFGIFVLFNTLLFHSRSALAAIFVVSLLLTSPLLVFYGLNFMADVPAFSLAVVCFCSLFHFWKSGITRFFYFALIIGTVAVLMKASALIPLCLTFLVGVLAVSRRSGPAALSVKKWLPVSAMAVSAAIAFGWYRYAIWYNSNDSNNIFLLTVLPIWEMDTPEILHKLKILFNVQFPLMLNRPMFFLVFVCAGFVIAGFRRLDILLRWSFVTSGVYFIAYILFFFWVFDVHDYYLINILIFPVITMFCTVVLLAQGIVSGFGSAFASIVVPVTILFNGFHSAAIYRLRMIDKDPMLQWFPFITKEEIAYAEYLFWNNSQDVKRVEHFTPVLRAHGISRHDRVLSIPDHSFNVTLYLMDQKGYTVARDHIMTDTTVMDRFMRKVDYIVLSDTTLKEQVAFRRTAHNFDPYFVHGPVKVYKMKRRR